MPLPVIALPEPGSPEVRAHLLGEGVPVRDPESAPPAPGAGGVTEVRQSCGAESVSGRPSAGVKRRYIGTFRTGGWAGVRRGHERYRARRPHDCAGSRAGARCHAESVPGNSSQTLRFSRLAWRVQNGLPCSKGDYG